MDRRRPRPLSYRIVLRGVVATALVVVSFGQVSVARTARAIDGEAAGLREDATLRDVAFLTPDDGWAVGDAGTVLRTTDGGQTWLQIDVDSSATLTGVAFADRERGLIVGWKLSPYTHRVSAEVLSTADGGETWIRQTNESRNPAAQAARLLPGFLGITSGADELTAFGHVNLHARTGLAPWSGPTLGFRREGLDRRTPIAAATRADAGAWLFAQADGSLDRLRDGALERVAFEGVARPVVRALAQDGGIVVAAGCDAFVAVSTDAGSTFRVADPLPPELRPLVHWKTAAVQGTSIWLAGSPGAIVARSEDAGATWQISSPSDPLPVEKLAFVDRSRGWAVGALGTIRKTIDGGRTWIVVRGEERAAALATFATTPDSLPFEPLAKHATVDGYRATNWILGDVDDQTAWSGATAGTRLAFACSTCGGGAVENAIGRVFPPGALEDPQATLARLSREGGPNEAMIVARLATWVRAWRPEAIVIPASASLGGTPADEQAHRLALAAIDRAADPQFDYAAMRALGLQPWRPKRVAAPSLLSEAGLRTDGSDYVAPAKLSLVEFVLTLRSYVEREPSRTWVDGARYAEITRSVAGRGGNDLLADVAATAGSARRRERPAPDAEKLRDHTESLPWRRSFQTLAHPETAGEGFVVRFEDAVRRTAVFSPDAAGAALHSVACLASARGRDDLAEAAWRALAARDPQGPFAEYAALRLAATGGSAEIAATLARAAESRAEKAELASTSRLPGVQSFVLPKATSLPDGESLRKDDIEYRGVEVQPGAFAFGPVPMAASEAIRAAEIGVAPASEAENPLGRLDDLYRAAPWTLAWSRPQFAAWSIGQANGTNAPGTNPGQLAASLPPGLAAYVDATTSGSGASFVRMVRAVEKPFLDGRLDDSLWRNATTFDGPAGERTAIAFDDEHLFLAYRSPKESTNGGPMSKGSIRSGGRTTRDAALSGYERLAILIDVDGDGETALRFEIDRFGRCRESLAGDSNWNPEWYAAEATEGDGWSVEVAIPRTGEWAGAAQGPIVSALAVYRISPGQGIYDALTGGPAEDSDLPLRRTLWPDGVETAPSFSTAALPTDAISFDTEPAPATTPPPAAAEAADEPVQSTPRPSLRPRRLPRAP